MTQYQEIFAQIFAATGAPEPTEYDRATAYTLYPDYIGQKTPRDSELFSAGLGNVLPWSVWAGVAGNTEKMASVDSKFFITVRNSDLRADRVVGLAKQIMTPAQQLLRKRLRIEKVPEPQIFMGWAAYPIVKMSGSAAAPPFGVKTVFVTSTPIRDTRPVAEGSANRLLGFPSYHSYSFERVGLNGETLPPVVVHLDADKPDFAPDIMNDADAGITGRTIANIIACASGGQERYLTIADLEHPLSPIADGDEEGPSYCLAVLQAALGTNMPIGYTGEITHDSSGRIVLRPIGDLKDKLKATVTSSRDGFLSKTIGTADPLMIAVPGTLEAGTISAKYGNDGVVKDAFRFASDLMFRAEDTTKHPYAYLTVDLAGVLLAQMSVVAGVTNIIREKQEEAAYEQDKEHAMTIQAAAQAVVNEYAISPGSFTGTFASEFYQKPPAEQAKIIKERINAGIPTAITTLAPDNTIKEEMLTGAKAPRLFDIKWWEAPNNPYYAFIFSGEKTAANGAKYVDVKWNTVPEIIRNSDEVRGNVHKYFMGVPRMATAKDGSPLDKLVEAMNKGKLKKLQGWLQAGASKLAAATKAAAGLTSSKNVSKLTKLKQQRTKGLIDSLGTGEAAPRSPLQGRSFKKAARRPPPTSTPPAQKRRTPPATTLSIPTAAPVTPAAPLPDYTETDMDVESGPSDYMF